MYPLKIKNILLILTITIFFCIIIIIFQYPKDVTNNNPDKKINTSSNLTYNQIINSETETLPEQSYKNTKFNSNIIEWQGKISAYYSQITGIKFCVLDEDHQNVDITKPCDMFWAFSDDLMDADNLVVNPNWDGNWVPYILNYYNVPFDENTDYYNDVYMVRGVVNGIDCAPSDKCSPDIEIIDIKK